MATFTQEAKNLVLVTSAFIPNTTSGDVSNIDATEVGLIRSNGIGYNANGSVSVADKVKLVLNTGVGPEPGSTENLMLVSEELNTANIVSLGFQLGVAPYEAANLITLPTAHDYTAGESVVIGIRFSGYGSVSMKNPYTKHGAYYVQSDADTNITVAAGLVENLNKNVAKDRTARVVASVGSDNTVDISTVISTAATISVVNNDIYASLNAAADATSAGWITVAGNLVYATITSGDTEVVFDRPYQGATDGTLAKASLVPLTNEQIVIVGQRQRVIDFEHPFEQIEFNTSVTKDRVALGVTENYVGSSKGVGFGPHVRNIESFANQATQRNQFVNKPRMYDERLQADPTKQYDCLSIKVATTKKGSGSNVTSVREIMVYEDNDNGDLGDLAVALSLIAPNASLSTDYPTP